MNWLFFLKRGLRLETGSFPGLNPIAGLFSKFIVLRNTFPRHLTVFTHNGGGASLVRKINSRLSPILTIIRFHPEYTWLISINGQYTSVDFDHLCYGNDIEQNVVACLTQPILVQNLVANRVLYFNFKNPCWRLKEIADDEHDIKVNYMNNILVIDLHLAKSGHLIGSILVTQPGREIRISGAGIHYENCDKEWTRCTET